MLSNVSCEDTARPWFFPALVSVATDGACLAVCLQALLCFRAAPKLPVFRVTLPVVSSQPAWSPDTWVHDADDMHFRWMLGKSLLWILHGAILSLLRHSGPCSMYDSQCTAIVRPGKGKVPQVCDVLIYCVTKSEL